MKQKETLLNTQENKLNDPYGEEHYSPNIETPLRSDAFHLDDKEKIHLIEKHFREIMLALGLDMNDDSLRNTPHRVAKMFVKEVFSGLNPDNKPKVTLFDNKYRYDQMIVEKDIHFYSYCEHHFVPIIGKAHVAYIPNGKVAGLSKLNRIVQHYARRPQVQERMTIQIANELKESLQTNDVAVMLEANHLCVSARGIKDVTSSTTTSEFRGKFNAESVRMEFLKYLEIQSLEKK